MGFHMFDTELAEELGVNAAIVYHAISYLCEHNRTNGRNIHDGLAWTYDSVAAMRERHPYLKESAIRKALKDLEAAGYIRSGNYNKSAYDRTKWYADTGVWTSKNVKIDLQNFENGKNEFYNSNKSTDKDTDTDTDTDLERARARKKPEKMKLGEYANVLLTAEELGKLKAEFPTDWERRVDRLSEYMASTGKTYKSHLATIRAWARKDREKTQPAEKQVDYSKTLYTKEQIEDMRAWEKEMWG